MPISERFYIAGVRGLRALSPLLARGESKLAVGVRGREGAARRLVAWGRKREAGPLVWFHAPSVGEGLVAKAVMEALGREAAGIRTVFTHFSPSAEALAARIGAAAHDYLPWDVPSEVGPVLDALTPSMVAFTKTEVWPVLSREALRRGIPTVLVGAALPEGSSRLSALARPFLEPAFGRLAAVHAIAE
ncbi:MAG TPA: glycosyltransferase N-terminal domain-containing protein, partial [Candidatus Thermoplasmatota archaeon]